MLRFVSCIRSAWIPKKLLVVNAHHHYQRNLSSKYLSVSGSETKSLLKGDGHTEIIGDFHSKSSQYPVVSGEGEHEYDYVKQLKHMEDFWIKNLVDLEKLIVLRKTLFLRFRVTVRKVMKPHLTEKVPRVKEESKGGNLVEHCEENDRTVDYSFFLKQLKKDIKRGNIDALFAANNFESGREFYETCEYALHGDREAFLLSRPSEVCYIEEEISCDIKFTNPFDEEAIFEEIEKIESEEIQQGCRRLVYYLGKLTSITH